MHSFLLKGFMPFCMTLIFLCESQSANLEIEQHCQKMYKKTIPKKKRQAVCACVVRNLNERFDHQQMEDVKRLYVSPTGRHEASKDEKKKGYLEYDSFVHAQCLQSPLWRRPTDDLGHPDEL